VIKPNKSHPLAQTAGPIEDLDKTREKRLDVCYQITSKENYCGVAVTRDQKFNQETEERKITRKGEDALN